MEIPLVYTGRHETPRRFAVNPQDFSVRSVPVDRDRDRDRDAVHEFVSEESLSGCASASSLSVRGKTVLLTTSALAGATSIPGVISVSMSKMQDPLDSPVTSQIDLRGLVEAGVMSDLVVKVQAFAETEGIIRIVIVDSKAAFVRVDFTESLLPIAEPAKVLFPSDFIDDEPVMDLLSGSEVRSNMVTFLSSDAVCLALSPFVFTVRLDTATSAIWSESKTLEDMKARSFSIGSILYHASDMLIGKPDTGILDMPPTAAMCVASVTNPLLEPTVVFTLHSDSSIRKWLIDVQSSPNPLEVAVLELETYELAPPTSWDDARNTTVLSARLYEQIYALSIQIKTVGYQNNGESNCQLCVIYGDLTSGSTTTCLPLSVPSEAVSLVGMDFNRTQTRCSLDAYFESSDKDGMMHVIYPPSVVSIVSSAPVVKSFQGSLDQVAGRERSRIEHLSYGNDAILTSSSLSDNSPGLDEDLHKIDTFYMKQIFRPIYPRGNGTTLPPSERHIRQAISKLTKGCRIEKDVSIELATFRAMHEWRNRESRRNVSPMKRRLSYSGANSDIQVDSRSSEPVTSLAVYESFAGNPNDDEEILTESDENGEENLSGSDRNWTEQVHAHEHRWRRLLLQVCEEERSTLTPLSCTWMDSSDSVVCIRAGLITVLTTSPVDTPESYSSEAILDEVSLKLLHRIESDPIMSARLYLAEQHAYHKISSARLALDHTYTGGMIHELTQLGTWAWSGDDSSDVTDGLSDAEHDRLEQAASSMTVDCLARWIHQIPEKGSYASFGVAIVSDHASAVDSSLYSNFRNQVASCQLRHSVCSVSIRCIDSMRRLQLGRCLLLLDLIESGSTSVVALRAYLHTLSVLWTMGQYVPMPATALIRNFGSEAGNDSPGSRPNKRLSFGDDASSILPEYQHQKTTLIDAQVIHISQEFHEAKTSPNDPVGAHVCMVTTALRLALSFDENPTFLLPELDILPRMDKSSAPSDCPKLALRLLSPFVAIKLPGDSPDLVLLRNEMLAECFLIESHGPPRSEEERALHVEMNQMACSVLVPSGFNQDGAISHEMVRSAFEALTSMSSSDNVGEVDDEDMEILLADILYGERTGLIVEIKRLSKLESVRRLFAPLITELELVDGVTGAAIKMLATVFQHFSRLMNRLEVLERHAKGAGGAGSMDGSTSLLEFADGAIREMDSVFPREIALTMPEYVQLWSRLFHRSILAENWTQAYAACVGNPTPEKRNGDLRRLVRSMVDSGALGELIQQCSSLCFNNSPFVGGTSIAEKCISLYEIASEVLFEASSSDIYSLRANSSDPSNLSDYLGALYSLHASQHQWRKAAQTMDIRFNHAKAASSGASSNIARHRETKALLDSLISEDLVLSSTSAVNAIELIHDVSEHYIVSGDFDTNCLALASTTVNIGSQNKRPRNPGIVSSTNSDTEDYINSRVSRFMTYAELQARAIRSICSRVLFQDNTAPILKASSSISHDASSIFCDAGELFELGYYQYGLLLSSAVKHYFQRQTGSGCKSDRCDIFYGSLILLSCGHLVPRAFSTSVSHERPSLSQIYNEIDAYGNVGDSNKFGSIRIGFTNGAYCSNPETIKAALILLLQKITHIHSRPEAPLAMHVAGSILENCSQLPQWLHSFLVVSSSSDAVTGFNTSSKLVSAKYNGDPSGLLSLYIQRGMIIEACALVESVLRRLIQSSNTSRLPEKGGTDCVPFKKIDMLWNLTDSILRIGGMSHSDVNQLKESQKSLEEAIKDYHSFLKSTELGFLSARALKRGRARQ